MLVLYKNNIYSLDMTYILFANLREGLPKMEVELYGVTDMDYIDKPLIAPIGELNDYSVERNLKALGK